MFRYLFYQTGAKKSWCLTESKRAEIEFLQKHYEYPEKPFTSDQHIMFINAEEDYGLSHDERPNWINFVRPPVERLVSFFYYFKFRPSTRVIQFKKS